MINIRCVFAHPNMCHILTCSVHRTGYSEQRKGSHPFVERNAYAKITPQQAAFKTQNMQKPNRNHAQVAT